MAGRANMLTAPKSKLGKEDMTTLLRKDDAWDLLSLESRQQLYLLLPPPREGEAAHDTSVNPLKTPYKPHIEEAIRAWQSDLRDGKETKKWREEAMQAGRDRAAGKFDEWKQAQREEYFGEMKGDDGEKVVENGDDDHAGDESADAKLNGENVATNDVEEKCEIANSSDGPADQQHPAS